ncbi:MAG: methylenetetrahydrofolate reductase [Bacteroidales bacterium]|nr:methylenetetrahydrofolate reductase [Bacteroidales bacterium]MDY2692492.1 methylenetetrahydrofolate reductase [Prevotella sp.]MDD5787916.1 methylenetetrahydrofolate reductase [Bacteroidales bacterium]MDD6896948.1 methylenetetrahydrofolate reductase [Bacteroidales bacterium]MDY4731483.1 methylenetetrahydrofolate reductase [Prevotella sp.]
MTKVIDILKRSRSPFASFELVPPLKGSDVSKLYSSIEPLMEFAPPFLNVTCHRDEVEYHENSDGTYTRMTLAKRPGTIAIVAAIMKRFSIDIVPHVICGGASKHKIESEMLDLHFLGIDNVVALRGDAIPGQRFFIPDPEGFAHTDELVGMISNLNKGRYLDPTVVNGLPTDFSIGVAGYPEKHYEAANMDTDIQHLKEKVEKGADYVITQMFFDNARYYDFVDRCRKAGITVPIIPGLKPISVARQIDLLPRSFHLDIPQDLVNEILKAKTKEQVYEAGVAWCVAQSQDLLRHGVPAIHYYTMGKADNIRKIVKTVF